MDGRFAPDDCHDTEVGYLVKKAASHNGLDLFFRAFESYAGKEARVAIQEFALKKHASGSSVIAQAKKSLYFLYGPELAELYLETLNKLISVRGAA